MKKTVSLFLSIIMLVSCFVLPMTARAASPNILSMTVNGTMVDSIIPSAISNINSYRSKHSYGVVSIDKTLTEQARVRVTEILFRGRAADTVESLPDGNSIYSRFPNWGVSTFTNYGTLSAPTTDKLQTYLDSFLKYSSASSYKSVGVAVFTYNSRSYWYAIASTNSAVQTYTYGSNFSYGRTVNVSTKYLDSVGIMLDSINDKGAYNLSTKAYFNGQCWDPFIIPNSQVKYKSSNATYFKVKGNKGYAKKNGNVTLSVTDTFGNKITESAINVYGNSSTPSFSYKYPKGGKKKITCKWYTYSNASGYQIRYSTKKNMKGAKTITVKGTNTEKKVIKKLKSGKKYYVQVRVFVNQGDGEKQYTVWSKKAAVKVK